MTSKIKYILIGFASWIIVDWGTAGGFTLAYWNRPVLGLFIMFSVFLGYPVLLSYFVFNRQWNTKKLFFITLAPLFFIEVIMSKNPLLIQFPHILAGVPLAVSIYSFLTFFPLWATQKTLKNHRKIMIWFSVVLIVVAILSAISERRDNKQSGMNTSKNFAYTSEDVT